MKFGLLLGLASIASTATFGADTLFRVDSTQEGLTIPYVVCANGKAAMSCYRFTAHGKQLFIMAKNPNHPNYKDVGIRLDIPGYRLEGCVPYSNGYCLFSVNNMGYSQLFIK